MGGYPFTLNDACLFASGVHYLGGLANELGQDGSETLDLARSAFSVLGFGFVFAQSFDAGRVNNESREKWKAREGASETADDSFGSRHQVETQTS